MSKLQWIGCLVVAGAVAAPSSRAEEPPPFPAPAPAPGGTASPGPVPAPEVRMLDAGYSDLAWVRWTGQTLRFEQARFQGEARLFARSKDRPGWQVFPGQDLEAIVRASPTLAAHPELPALRAHVAGPATVRVVVKGFALGYEHDPELGESKLYSRSPQGETMWPGPDLATIAAENPEVTRLQEWPAFEARVREASSAALPLHFRPGAGGVAVATFEPRAVSLTLHQWRSRGWEARTYRGSSLAQLVRGSPDLVRILDAGDLGTQPLPPSNPTPMPAPGAPRAPQPAPNPRTYPPSSPPAGGGSACGAGGKACGR